MSASRTVSAVDLAWERWRRQNPGAALYDAWCAAWSEAYPAGVRDNAQLGVGVTMRQVQDIKDSLDGTLSRLEAVARLLTEDEAGSAYWKSEA